MYDLAISVSCPKVHLGTCWYIWDMVQWWLDSQGEKSLVVPRYTLVHLGRGTPMVAGQARETEDVPRYIHLGTWYNGGQAEVYGGPVFSYQCENSGHPEYNFDIFWQSWTLV